MSNIRADGRSATDIRPVSIQLGQLSRADGSARFGFGSTACLASFTGPIEVRIREEMPDRATLEVSHRPLGSVGATPSRALESALEAAFTPLLALAQHPRSLLQLVVQSLSSPANTFEDLSATANSRRNDDYAHVYESGEGSGSTGGGDDEMDGQAGISSKGRGRASAAHTWPKSGSYFSTTTSSSAPSTSISFSERAAALNASSLAVLDAGAVAASGVVVAVSAAYVSARSNAYAYVDDGAAAARRGEDEELELILDPTPEEEERAKARFGFAWAFGQGLGTARGARHAARGEADMDLDAKPLHGPKEGAVVWVESEGRFSRDQFKQAMAASRSAAEGVLELYRAELQKHIESRQRA